MAQHSHPPRRVAQSPKQNTFFGGAAVLAAGILVVKLIGLFYKIPLLNIIGEQGTADFGNAYNIYAADPCHRYGICFSSLWSDQCPRQ